VETARFRFGTWSFPEAEQLAKAHRWAEVSVVEKEATAMQIEVDHQPNRVATLQSQTSEQIHIGNILVPTDFSDGSRKAVIYGISLARQFGARLSLLHVVEPTPPFTGLETVPIAIEPQTQLADGEKRMGEFVAQNVPADVAVTPLVRSGSTAREISDFAKTHEIDLLIASIHPHNRVSRAVFGGITERIVHQAPCPILIVRENEHEFLAAEGAHEIRIKRILAPIDFTPCSNKALRYAFAFARKFDANVFSLHVIEPEKPLIVIETAGFGKEQVVDTENRMKDLLESLDGSVMFETAVVHGSPHREIIDAADERDVDLVVVGEHCRTGLLGRFMLGSTADEVVKGAHCPILVVRPVEREFVD
jgi:nucleotide-binding universal stress UspA family protein